MRRLASTTPSSIAPTMMNMMNAVDRVVSMRASRSTGQLRVRKAAAMSSAPKAPTAAASVGVMTPA